MDGRRGRRRAGGASGGRLPAGATARGDAASNISVAGGLLGLGAVLPSPRDVLARRRGRALLGGLGALQRALLAGEPDAAALHGLAGLVEGEDGDDPGMAEAMRALRCAPASSCCGMAWRALKPLRLQDDCASEPAHLMIIARIFAEGLLSPWRVEADDYGAAADEGLAPGRTFYGWGSCNPCWLPSHPSIVRPKTKSS